jgi:hypothetical protein
MYFWLLSCIRLLYARDDTAASKDSHCAGPNTSLGPRGCLESRTATSVDAKATSTQSSLLV